MLFKRIIISTFALGLVIQAGLVSAHEVEPATAAVVGSFSYHVAMEGIDDDVAKELVKLTEAHKQNDNPPPTVYLLKRRLDNDTEILTKAMHARGYYDAQVTDSLDTEKQPYQAMFHVNKGEAYILKSIQVVLDPRSETQDAILPEPDALKLPVGGAVNYEAIENAVEVVRGKTYEANCLRRVRVRAHLRVDTAQKTAQAIYRVRAGRKASFGELTIDGLNTIERPYVERKIPWQVGECYTPKKIENLQVALLQTNLFSTSDIKVADEPDENGHYPVSLTLKERAQRTIKAGIGYATEEGLDFKPSWEHRNFFGQGEKVTFESTLSTFLQSIKGKLERPDFLRKSQTLILQSEIAQSETDAYDVTSLSASAQLSRPLAKNLTGALGIAYALKRVDDDGLNSGEETFSLVSFPSFLEHSTRDNTLDPTKGHVLRLDVEPYVETLNTGNVFLKTQGTARFYHQHSTIPLKPTWALRGTVGSITGSSRSDLPADERFYSGGGGSVRGYGYQLLGPLTNGTPDGGRSLVEFSAELRLRASESVGIVPFVDAGNVYNEPYPEFDGDLYYAAGLGLRYYTGFGPFRFDVALPLDKRDGVDDSFQIYLSFGQSF
jgi:translocation and assembly module TamA